MDKPLILGTRIIYLNSDDVLSIKIDMDAAKKAMGLIKNVSNLGTPTEQELSKWRYDEEYVKTVLLSWSARAMRDLLVNPAMAEYVEEVYKLDIDPENFRLDPQQKEGLKNLDLKFRLNEKHWQNELTYINTLIDHYISDVLPILKEVPQKTVVKFKNDVTADVPLNISIVLI